MPSPRLLMMLLAAIFGISAVLASAAHAETEFKAGSYPAILTGEKTIESELLGHIFTYGSVEIECESAQFSGTMSAASTSITVTPTYAQCDRFGSPVTVTMNGCDYVFRSSGPGTADIVCPGGNDIVIEMYGNAASHASGTALCGYTIGAQNGLGSNTFSNTGGSPSEIDITSNLTGIWTKRVTGSALLCGAAEGYGNYKGLTRMKAYQDLFGSEGSRVNFEA